MSRVVQVESLVEESLPKNSYFAELGITSVSTLADIRKAYHQLALQYHPDKDHTPGADERFKAISKEFELLKAKWDLKQKGAAQQETRLPGESQTLSIDFKSDSLDVEEINNFSSDLKTKFDFTIISKSNFDKNSFLFQEGQSFSQVVSIYEPFSSLKADQVVKIIKAAISKYAKISHTIKDNAFLWKAEKEGCAPIYIFCSQHMATYNFLNVFGDAIKNILSQVELVCTEVTLDVDKFPEPLKSKNGKIVFEPDKLIAYIAHQMKKKLKCLEDGNIRDVAYNFEAFTAEDKLVDKQVPSDCDNFLSQDLKDSELSSEDMGSDIGFEKNIPQSAIFKMVDIDEVVKYVDAFLDNFDYLDKECKQYLTYVTKFSLDEMTRDANRNFVWIDSIMAQSRENIPALIVCGAVHSAGKYGLPNLLAHEGYTLTPVMKTAPILESTIPRSLVQQSLRLGMFRRSAEAVTTGKELVVASRLTS